MTLGVDELRRLSLLLDESIDLPPDGREAWMAGIGDDARHLLPTLRALLERNSQKETNDLLARGPIFDLAASGPKPGDVVGAYRLLSELGSGGMAAVWLAERRDGSFKRKVALKLPHMGWAPGLADRFAREREILSSLEHQHIARLYDAGLDEMGRPYMALEYVDGKRIDEFCRQRALDVPARLKLLLQVADAVAFAHSRLVVHRDLKPSNILVTDGGEVRLLDFGIAKLMEVDRASETALTRAAGRALTLDYASPEQIRGEPIGTASDVYSLGVVAFELLAGVRPYKLRRGSAAELEEAITSQDLPLASMVAQSPAARHALRGDLDAILNKALKKTADERYTTIDALAQDWRRHLDGQRVLARPDTLAYRFVRLARRHRAPMAAGAAVIAGFVLAIGFGATSVVVGALMVGLGAALWQARKAREQARLARAEARTAEAVQDFLQSIFRTNTGAQADPVKARQRTAKELLDEGAARIARELQDVPVAKLRVLNTLASIYYEMAEFDRALDLRELCIATAVDTLGQGSSEELHARSARASVLFHLERLDDAAAELVIAADVLAGRSDHSLDARIAYHEACAYLGWRRSTAAGIAATDQALALLRELPPSEQWINLLSIRTALLNDAGRPADALAAAREALALIAANATLGRNMESSFQLLSGEANAALGDLDAAAIAYRDSISAADRNQGPHSPHAVISRVWFAQFLLTTSQLRQAAELLSESMAIVDGWPDSSTRTTFAQKVVTEALGAYVRLGWLDQARTLALRGTAMNAEQMQNRSFAVRFLVNRAALQVELGQFEAAEQGLEGARLSIERDGLAADPVNLRSYGPARVRLHAARGEAEEALDALRKWQVSSARSEPLSDDDLIGLHAAATASLVRGDAADAARLCERGLRSLERDPRRASHAEGEASLLAVLGQAQMAMGDAARALDALGRAETLQGEVFDAERSPSLARVQVDRGQAFRAAGDPAAALDMLQRAKAIYRWHEQLGPQHLRPLHELERALAHVRAPSALP